MPYDRLILSGDDSRPVRITLTARQTTPEIPFDAENASLFRTPGAQASMNAYRFLERKSEGGEENPPPAVTPEEYPEALDYAIDDMIDRDSDGYGFPPEDDEPEEEENGEDSPAPPREFLAGLLEQLEEYLRDDEEFGDDDLIMQVAGRMEKRTLPDGSLELSVSYEEMLPEEGTTTVITLNSCQPDTVTVSRFGPVSSMIVCEEGARHTTAYRTPYAALELAVLGRRVDAEVSYLRGGVIEFDYYVEIRGMDLQHTKMRIEISPTDGI